MGGRRLALVVAVDRYDDEGLGRLAAPAADAAALAEVLGDSALGGFEVEVVCNGTDSTIRERIEDLLADRSRDDVVLLHFSCHGIKDPNGELVLAATNTSTRRLASTAVEAAWVSRQVRRTRAGSVVLLLDCCFGGAFERGMIPRAAGDVDVVDQFTAGQREHGRGLAIITASTASEYAFEGTQLIEAKAPEPSVFTSALVEGIRTGDADRNRDGHVTLGELYDYVYERVRQQTPRQTPSKWELGVQGGLFIARSPARADPPQVLSPGLLGLVRHDEPAGRLGAVVELADLASGTEPAIAIEARRTLDRLRSDASPKVAAAAAQALARRHAGAGQETDQRSIIASGVTVLVTSLARSVAFYRDMLGFQEIGGGDGNAAVLASGDTKLVLREISDVSSVASRTVHLNLEVGDLSAMYEELKAKGVPFTYRPRPVNRSGKLEQWAAAFKDPDGHGIALTQWRTRKAD